MANTVNSRNVSQYVIDDRGFRSARGNMQDSQKDQERGLN